MPFSREKLYMLTSHWAWRDLIAVDGKYEDATAVILAGLGSELKADVELFGTSSESESELGQEKVQPTMEESGTKSGSDREGSDGEGTDGSDGDDLLEIDVAREV